MSAAEDTGEKPLDLESIKVHAKKAQSQRYPIMLIGVVIVVLAVAASFLIWGNNTLQTATRGTTIASSTTVLVTQPSSVGTSSATTITQNSTNTCGGVVTVYVGQNMTCSLFRVQLQGLGEPNANDISPAQIGVYFEGTLVDTTQVFPGSYGNFSYSSHRLTVYVNQTNQGVYAYERWARVSLSAT